MIFRFRAVGTRQRCATNVRSQVCRVVAEFNCGTAQLANCNRSVEFLTVQFSSKSKIPPHTSLQTSWGGFKLRLLSCQCHPNFPLSTRTGKEYSRRANRIGLLRYVIKSPTEMKMWHSFRFSVARRKRADIMYRYAGADVSIRSRKKKIDSYRQIDFILQP